MVSSVTKMSTPVTAEEKTNKKNDVKARSLLLMALPNEHQLTFIWMNKAKIETMSIDDLYNNFKIVEQNVKKSVGTSSGSQNLAFMTAPRTSSTNDVNTAKPAYENPNGSNLLQQDLEQIHEDDLEAMDLKWQLSLLSMRAKRYVVPTGRVVVPTSRYVVPTGKVIIIVSTGRLSLVPTGSDKDSDDASVHSEATITQQQRNIQPQIITTVSNNNAKFRYLKKDEYK
ncbi:hypothetical protein Tco_1466816, partial [Tanacetum coccineum]